MGVGSRDLKNDAMRGLPVDGDRILGGVGIGTHLGLVQQCHHGDLYGIFSKEFEFFCSSDNGMVEDRRACGKSCLTWQAEVYTERKRREKTKTNKSLTCLLPH